MALTRYSELQSIFQSALLITCGFEVVDAFVRDEEIDDASVSAKAIDRARGDFAQERVKFCNGVFDKVEVWAVGRQEEQRCADRLDRRANSLD